MFSPLPGTDHRQLAVFVGGGIDALAFVEPMLDGSRYDVEFVDMDDEPYGTIVAMKPDLVVVNIDLDELSAFQLLTMLRLDPRTAAIPVLSYVKDGEVSAAGAATVDPSASQLHEETATGVQRH
jgi:CheY-like chemotaxis protein